MAEIQLKQTGVSQFDAPDISKAGALFSAGLNKLATTAKNVETGIQTAATDKFSNALRQAGTQEELAALDPNTLGDSFVNAQGIQAAENALRGKQLGVLGSTLESDRLGALDSNRKALESALSSNASLKRSVSIDEGGNIQFQQPNDNLTQEQIDADTNAFGLALQKTGFNAIPGSRQFASDIRKQAKGFNATKEESDALVQGFSAFQKGLSTLTEEEQTIVGQRTQAIDDQTAQQILALDAQRVDAENKVGYTSKEAQELLRTKRGDVEKYIDGKLGDEFFFMNIRQFSQKAGVDVKEQISDIRVNGIDGTKGFDDWMFLRALSEVADVESGEENIDSSDFKEALLRIKNDTGFAENLSAVSQLDNIVAKDKLTLNQQALVAKTAKVSEVKGAFGVRNAQRNARFFNQDFQQPTTIAPEVAPGVNSAPFPEQALREQQQAALAAQQTAAAEAARRLAAQNGRVVGGTRTGQELPSGAPISQIVNLQNAEIEQNRREQAVIAAENQGSTTESRAEAGDLAAGVTQALQQARPTVAQPGVSIRERIGNYFDSFINGTPNIPSGGDELPSETPSSSLQNIVAEVAAESGASSENILDIKAFILPQKQRTEFEEKVSRLTRTRNPLSTVTEITDPGGAGILEFETSEEAELYLVDWGLKNGKFSQGLAKSIRNSPLFRTAK